MDIKHEKLKTMHLFAGIGGGLLADLILGHTPVVSVEWDRYACAVLRERVADGWLPGMQVWEGDVRMFDPSEYARRVDCIHAGFPCQDISNAGKQAGVGEETRSGLYREVLRIADAVRPRYIFLENVSAILNNGLGTVLGDLASRSYDARWVCVRASDVGADHERDRIFILAENKTYSYANGFRQQKQGRCRDGIGTEANPYWEASWFVDAFQRESLPYVCRRHDGVSFRMDSIKALGNAQVPLQAAVAFKILEGMM